MNSTSIPSRDNSLSGAIVPARVTKTYRDHCDLDLLSPEHDSVLGKGRLYQAESAAWQQKTLFANIADYQVDKILPAVFIRSQRHTDGQPLWFVHERWGRNNPWPELELVEGDIVTGKISHLVLSGDRSDPVGYLIQLETGAVLETVEYTPGLVQPDIEVFLPIDEVPWATGHLSPPKGRNPPRLPLYVGEPIQARVLEVWQPPKNPVVSLIRLIHYRDAGAQRDFDNRDTLAAWRFREFARSGRVPENLAQADETEPSGDQPYRGKRLLLVDDEEPALESLAELLRMMGADVNVVLVKPNALDTAVESAADALRASPHDLALIDNNLPRRDQGFDFVERLHRKLGDGFNSRCCLLTANAFPEVDDARRDVLRAQGLAGMLHRPLRHHELHALLSGEEIWSTTTQRPTNDDATVRLDYVGTSPMAVLEAIIKHSGLRFAMLVKAQRNIEPQDIISAGKAPFSYADYSRVMVQTDLHLLAEARIPQMELAAGDVGNEFLRASHGAPAYWQVLEIGAERWMLGVGFASGMNLAQILDEHLSLWLAALGAALESQGWRSWAHHVSSFVELGLAHHGLNHEVFHVQAEFDTQLRILKRLVSNVATDQQLPVKDKLNVAAGLVKLDHMGQQLRELSDRLLRGHAMRHRHAYLPDVAESIRGIASAECKEMQVALHVAKAPELALPLPQSALVLPAVNLLINAAKHHYRHENRRVELLFDLEDGGQETPTLIIDIRDNGPGLDAKAMTRLWQPGYSAATDPEQRLGIGLWLSRQLVEEAGGTILIQQNWRGTGLWFRLCFPIHLG